MGDLYIVSTPIGNIADISLRAIEILKKVDFILAEDTRRTGILLNKYQIKTPMNSFHEHNEEIKQPLIIEKLKEGKNIAIVSDSGTPTVSDPGFKLVRQSVLENIQTIPIPGASSVSTALIASGLPTDSFSFLGYVPKKGGSRQKFFKKISLLIEEINTTVIFFETPHRILKTIGELEVLFPNKDIVIAKELTKVHEKFIRAKVIDIRSLMGEKKIKGEITVLLH